MLFHRLYEGIDCAKREFGESGIGETGIGETGFGESGFGESGIGETGFGESGGHRGEWAMYSI
jgi:hypothetical protein